ncbi:MULTISPECIES: TRAP transporter small permease [unclassified Bosea (in: a-proteobacteria)]|uniref:TRAP transporter small permease n=1 Tax=unclassified Bosea (in: a-proteobacteria) TaxID=2653178 RepID=UPI00095602BB|nr:MULTISPECIES: TRAP transporter small permease [unclassified Bosea (in: a-proteobacteria)]TAJ34432.1 MAG: TRAP transporter small permease [Bosea sp. (in: a-proteobacteria)]SIQ61720.1 TRAP-type C4-dicarboxylate transport system, small permease component [Bosea sp. TND4EK4]
MTWTRVFDRAMEAVAALLIVALLVTVTLGIVTRAMGEPLIWTDEVSRFLMLWVAVVGWVMASRRRVHIRIRFFHDMMPARGWRTAEALMQLAMMLFGALTLWYSIHLVQANYDLEATTVPLSMGLLYAPMVLAGLVTLLQGLAELVENLRNWGRSPYPPMATDLQEPAE